MICQQRFLLQLAIKKNGGRPVMLSLVWVLSEYLVLMLLLSANNCQCFSSIFCRIILLKSRPLILSLLALPVLNVRQSSSNVIIIITNNRQQFDQSIVSSVRLQFFLLGWIQMPHLRQINCICCEAENSLQKFMRESACQCTCHRIRILIELVRKNICCCTPNSSTLECLFGRLGEIICLIYLLIAIKIYEWQRLMKQMDESH